MPETSLNSHGRWLQGEHDWISAMADRPLNGGPGNRHAPRWTAGQSVDVTGRLVSKTAGSSWVSGTVAHVSKHRLGMRRGTRSLTGPWARETPGPPLDTAGRSADISVVFLFSYRGRLKWSHLHCWPDAVA